ncbi:hypothetical protein SAMN05421810_103249 [Amycolatopsis arida]|uniref:Uncharacterized protein n=1 Tax=Amycolatopsis arida TaxID=587909 RepID=A0A1I5SRY1_9PSEU|nr:hypothetical protein [Amycolatopsis arida]TDX96372.1 hypothetical protein CLV69_103509 [Amycolatopsis arida]SFP73530.1 hypothetical protein SAMN05421810_103249 [Amycolatopsis arida]
MSEQEPSRRAFFGLAGRTLATAAAAAAVPAVALAAPGGAAAAVAGVDAVTGEPLDAGADCDRGFGL